MKTNKLTLSFLVLIFISTSVLAQKPKPKSKTTTTTKTVVKELSKAEKMGYARTNKYWGPGTYYCFAPGVPNAKMVNTQESAMRDLTGISREDCYTELSKQGFVAVPPKEVQKWFNETKSKDNNYFYSTDKSYILRVAFNDMFNSQYKGDMPFSTDYIERYVLVPKQDSLKVIDMAWQYLRDLYNMKILMASFNSTYKNCDPKSYPIQQTGSTGWNSMRAGSYVLRNIGGKVTINWDRNEEIVRRTIGKPEFKLIITGMETDFGYTMNVKLQKEGYVVTYMVGATTLSNLEPGTNWIDKHKENVVEYNGSMKMDKEAIELYKKAPFPPVLEDINKLLKIK